MAFQAEANLYLGDMKSAKALNAESMRILDMLIAKDPQNANWLQVLFKAKYTNLSMIPHSDWSRSNDADLDRLHDSFGKLSAQDPSNSRNKTYLAAVLREKALRALHAGNFADAMEPAKSAHALMLDIVKKSDPSPQLLVSLAKTAELLGTAMTANQQAEAAELIWSDTVELLDRQSISVFDFYPVRYLLAIDLNQTEKAKEIEKQLLQAGFKDPRMQPAHTLSGTFR
jgi:hypothetical protein